MRLLFVAMPDSVHAARWIGQVSGQGWDVHLFPATPRPPNPYLNDITTYGFAAFRPPDLAGNIRWNQLWPKWKGTSQLSKLAHMVKPDLADRAAWLARVIEQFRPDLIHSLEMQHAGYLTLEAQARVKGPFPTWIVTNWGSDIYLFGRIPYHAEKIRSVLAKCHYYACECERDVALAREFGFRGETFPVLPGAGGYDLEKVRRLRQPGTSAARRLILLKGYQGWAGRALVGLRALERCADALKGYEVAIYLAGPEVELAAQLISQRTGIPIRIVPYCSHEEMLGLHGQARISIGLSISDAISTSLLEAMMMGSFPIQSHTACADEWIIHNRTGLIVHPDDPETVEAAIRKAVADDELIEQAAAENARVAAERLDQQKIRSQVVALYRDVARSVAQRQHLPGGEEAHA